MDYEIGYRRLEELDGLFGKKLFKAEQDLFGLKRSVRNDAQKQYHSREKGHK